MSALWLAALGLLALLCAVYAIGAAVAAIRDVLPVLEHVDSLGHITSHTSPAGDEGQRPLLHPAASTMGPRAATQGEPSHPARGPHAHLGGTP